MLALDFPPYWAVLIAIAVGLSAWLGFFVYRNTEYSGELWWQFSLYGDASRFLRSFVAIAVVAAELTGHRLMTRTSANLELPDAAGLECASAVVATATETNAHLALTGDKYFLWSERDTSLIMFGMAQGFWVAMGDPVGEHSEFPSLARNFRDLADRHSAKIAFYQVGDGHLPIYIDLGLALIKLGEEARVPLREFGLEGSRSSGLRRTNNKFVKDGHTLEIVPPVGVPRILPELRAISDHWLTDKRTREKRFSLGFFQDAYVSRCDAAVVRKDGRIIAFANIWKSADHEELSMDMMRYEPGAENGVMEFLIVQLMFWGKAQGYKWFNLGMAPLAGLATHPLAPLWHKIGNTVFRLSSEFYNFDGLLQYKSKFDPVWQPRYLACLPGLHGAQALIASTSLISQGLKGAIVK